MDPTLSERIAEATAPITSGVKDAVNPIAEKAGAAVSGFFGGIGKMLGGNKEKESSVEEIDSTEE